MAEIAVSSAAERLKDLLISEAFLLGGLSYEVFEIHRELERMGISLKDADKKQTGSETVRKWMSDTRELVFRAEDVIETFAMEVENKKQKSGIKETVQRLAYIYSETKMRKNFTMEINEIKSMLVQQSATLAAWGILKEVPRDNVSLRVIPKDLLMGFFDEIENDSFGRQREIDQIISHLKEHDKGCELISVCGVGGSGKTTLAQKLYNHVKVRAHFKALAWVSISQHFDREKVFRGALEQLLPPNRKEEISRMDNEELVKELYIVQLEKNCLIVIDDVWTVDSWRLLEPAFPVGDATCGSKILLTTRNPQVAEVGSVFTIHDLTEDAGWEILLKKSRINETQEKLVACEMEEIGRAMLKMCRDSPLAISSLGGFLKRKSLQEWKMIKRDMSLHLASDGEHNIVEHVLGLSYDSLPLRLKYCFLCFANYKEDEVLEARELYMIWIAEGLISKEDKAEGEMMLDVAERYLIKLANLGLIQFEDSRWSKKRTCRVHNIIRNFCLMKVEEEEFMTVIHIRHQLGNEFKASKIRRLSIYSHDDGYESMLRPYDPEVISHIRSVFVRKANSTVMEAWPDKILSLQKFKVLRVLTVNSYELTIQNINDISELLYLKYLCLRNCNCKFKEFPSSIGNLRNLGTIDLRVSSKVKIPNVLWKLKMLKHLYLPEVFEEGGSIHKLSFAGLNELELIYNYNAKYCDARDLLLLPKLKVIDGGVILEDSLADEIVDYIKSKEFVSSVFEGEGAGQRLISILSKYHHDMVGSNDRTGETSQPTPSL